MLTTLFLALQLAIAPADTITDYYEVETIPTPDGLTVESGGLTFLPDGRLAACFHRGEVMLYDPKTKKWALFAEGLHDPLGIIALTNSELLVMQRPELTRIKDTNGDGVADVYETVSDQFGMSGNYHEFAFGPVRDKQGNLYIALNAASNGAGIRQEVRGQYDSLSRKGRMYSCVPYRGWVMQITPDGKTRPYALGFRSPNGMGFDAKGRLLVSDNQGDWLGTSKLYYVEPGKFYGHPASLIWKEDFPDVEPMSLSVAQLDSMRTKEVVAFPHQKMAHSPTQIITDETGGKFWPFASGPTFRGPMSRQTFVGEMDFSRLLRVMLEDVNGQVQGACIPFFDKAGLKLGNNRLAFAPDGSLWLGQTDHGWVGSRGLQRIRYKPGSGIPLDIVAMSLTKTGFDLTFTQPLDEAQATQVANFAFRRYYYKYHSTYGSPETDIAPVPVSSATLSPDRKTLSLTLTDLRPGYVYELTMGPLTADNGQKKVANRLICYTLNKLR